MIKLLRSKIVGFFSKVIMEKFRTNANYNIPTREKNDPIKEENDPIKNDNCIIDELLKTKPEKDTKLLGDIEFDNSSEKNNIAK